MSVLQFGATGQLARAVQVRALERGADLRALSRADADVTDEAAVRRAIASAAPGTLVLNASAFSLVDKAEADQAEAFAVNGTAPGVMAQACAERGLPFVHVSTDNVFDGSGTEPWAEDAAPSPINAYGCSKLAGETATLGAGGRALVVRTSWVFSQFGSNFVQIMLGVADRPLIRVVDDQLARPTPALALADFLLSLEPLLTGPEADRYTGIVHFAGDEAIDRYRFAKLVFAAAGVDPAVVAVPSSAFPTPAERPKNGVLGLKRLIHDFKVQPPPWRPALTDLVRGLAKAHGDPA